MLSTELSFFIITGSIIAAALIGLLLDRIKD